MRGSRLTKKDAAATALMAAAMALYALTESGVAVPGMDSARMRASAVFLLGVFAFGAGAASDAFTERGVILPIISVLTVLGLATLVVGIAAILSGSVLLLDALVGGIGLLWFGATLRHLTTPRAGHTTRKADVETRELVKR